jgi:hypothetical protein
MMQPVGSIRADQPGRITVVVSRSSMMAGPAISCPAASVARS